MDLRELIRKLKRKLKRKPLKRVFLDMDGTLAEWRKGETFDSLYKKKYFLSLRPQKRLVWSIRLIIVTGLARLLRIDFYVLTSYLTDSEYAMSEKERWVRRKLPELRNKIIFVPYGHKKTDYVHGCLTKDDFLLDDYNVNLKAWEGTPIKYLNGINSEWEGRSVRHDSKTLGLDLLKIVLAK